MTSVPDSLWGDLGSIETTRTPNLILQEQASLLRQLTDGVLDGVVVRYNRPPYLGSGLYITSNALDGYRLQILRTRHLVDIYPVHVSDYVNDISYDVSDETELVGILEHIFTSEKVQRAIGVLISESNAEM